MLNAAHFHPGREQRDKIQQLGRYDLLRSLGRALVAESGMLGTFRNGKSALPRVAIMEWTVDEHRRIRKKDSDPMECPIPPAPKSLFNRIINQFDTLADVVDRVVRSAMGHSGL